ncbi:DUF998 domain-containing protein [Streptomyces sp. NPDC005805]|uniref:DUF998 domain-containing protein n=1 Tax=Streptomyces sp. NPDC005805 TaxID=3157068 RepID=UPI0033CC6EAE
MPARKPFGTVGREFLDAPETRRPTCPRIVVLIGSGAVALYVALMGMLHLASDLDWATHETSRYFHGPLGSVFVMAVLMKSVAAFAAAAALRWSTGTTAAPALLAVYGVCDILSAVFPIASEETAGSSGIVHAVAGNIAFLAFPAAALITCRAFLRTPLDSPHRRSLLTATGLSLLAVPLVLAFAALSTAGVGQRILMASTCLTLLVVFSATQALRFSGGRAVPAVPRGTGDR